MLVFYQRCIENRHFPLKLQSKKHTILPKKENYMPQRCLVFLFNLTVAFPSVCLVLHGDINMLPCFYACMCKPVYIMYPCLCSHVWQCIHLCAHLWKLKGPFPLVVVLSVVSWDKIFLNSEIYIFIRLNIQLSSRIYPSAPAVLEVQMSSVTLSFSMSSLRSLLLHDKYFW